MPIYMITFSSLGGLLSLSGWIGEDSNGQLLETVPFAVLPVAMPHCEHAQHETAQTGLCNLRQSGT